MKFTITFEYEVETEEEAREIRDSVSPAVHDPYQFNKAPDNWFYTITKSREEIS